MKTWISLTLNQKLEMINLSEEAMLKAEIGWKLGLLCLVSQAVNAKVMFFKETTISVNTQVIRNGNSLIADMEKVLVIWIDQTNRNIPLSQKPSSNQGPISWRLREMRKLQKKSLKLAEVSSWGLKKPLHMLIKLSS